MRTGVKVLAYVGLTASALLFALTFREAYRQRAAGVSKTSAGSMGVPGAACVLCLVGIGLLLARDASGFVASKSYDFVFNDESDGVKNPEYEHAEEVWKAGDHLEAVRLMRDYYQRNPREVFVALRIAEIYEQDLRNYLAAALEYELVLKQKLPAERWGWAAIHLVNLYGKLNQTDRGTALLQRIHDEFGHTAAAKKARERLGIPEPIVVAPPEPEPEPEEHTPPPPSHNLPSGFRPK